MVELPLCAMRTIGIGRLPRRNAANLHIKRMAFIQVCGLRLAAQLLRNFFASADEFSLGRRPSYFNDLCCVDLVHASHLTTQAQRPGPRAAKIATRARGPGSL